MFSQKKQMVHQDYFHIFMKIMKYKANLSDSEKEKMQKWGFMIIGRTRIGKSTFFQLLQHNSLQIEIPSYNLQSPKKNKKNLIKEGIDSYTQEPNTYYDSRFDMFVIDTPGIKDRDIKKRVENSYYIHQVVKQLDYVRICIMTSLQNGIVQDDQFLVFKQIWKMFPKSSQYLTIIINCVCNYQDDKVINNFKKSLLGHCQKNMQQGFQNINEYYKQALQNKPYILRHSRYMKNKSQKYTIDKMMIKQLLTKDTKDKVKFHSKDDFSIQHADLCDRFHYNQQQKFKQLVDFFESFIGTAFNQIKSKIIKDFGIPLNQIVKEINVQFHLQTLRVFEVIVKIKHLLQPIYNSQMTSSEEVGQLKYNVTAVLDEIIKVREVGGGQISLKEIEEIHTIFDALQFLFSMFEDCQNNKIQQIQTLLKKLKREFFDFIRTFEGNLGLSNILYALSEVFRKYYKQITLMNQSWKYDKQTSIDQVHPLLKKLTLSALQALKEVYKCLQLIDPEIQKIGKDYYKKAFRQASIIVQNYELLSHEYDLTIFIEKAETLQKNTMNYDHLKVHNFYTQLLIRLSEAYLKVLSDSPLNKHNLALENCLQIYKDLRYYNQIEDLLMNKQIVGLEKKHYQLFIKTGEYFQKEGDNRMAWKMYVRGRECNRNFPQTEKQEQIQKKLEGLRKK